MTFINNNTGNKKTRKNDNITRQLVERVHRALASDHMRFIYILLYKTKKAVSAQYAVSRYYLLASQSSIDKRLYEFGSYLHTVVNEQ